MSTGPTAFARAVVEAIELATKPLHERIQRLEQTRAALETRVNDLEAAATKPGAR